MGTKTLVSVGEYLSTCYDPEPEYVDGVLEERNGGDWFHSLVQSNVIFALRRKYPHLKVVPELRSRTAESRFRLPDVSVLLEAPPTGRFLSVPAHIAIEILSEDDSMTRVMAKLGEYEAFGVPHIWLIDPRLRTLSVYRAGDLIRAETLAAGDVQLTPGEAFEE